MVIKPIVDVMPESWCVAQMVEGHFVEVVPHLLVLQARAARLSDQTAQIRLMEMLAVANWEVARYAHARTLFARVLHYTSDASDVYYRIRAMDAIAAMRMKNFPVGAAILEEIGTECDEMEETTRQWVFSTS